MNTAPATTTAANSESATPILGFSTQYVANAEIVGKSPIIFTEANATIAATIHIKDPIKLFFSVASCFPFFPITLISHTLLFDELLF